jgi:hypothetical protein
VAFLLSPFAHEAAIVTKSEQRGDNKTLEKTNARAVSDPGACVTNARQPP